MNALLRRAGRTAAHHPWRVIAVWIVILGGALGLASAFGGTAHDVYKLPGSRSQTAQDLLTERWPAQNGADARVIVHSRTSAVLSESDLAELVQRLKALDKVADVGTPRLAASGRTAMINLRYGIPTDEVTPSLGVDALERAGKPLEDKGLQVEFGGSVPESVSPPGETAEIVGIIAALTILIFAFGNVLAAGLPVAVALAGLGIGMSLVELLATVIDVSTTAPTIATMVGIGVGVDYALLLLTRYAEELRRGKPVPDAVVEATTTAGQSVVFAGFTVLTSLMGLRFSGIPVFDSYGYATACVVLVVVLTAVTLVPALCSLAGTRVLGSRARARLELGYRAAPRRATLTRRWATLVGRRPMACALWSLSILVLLAAPVTEMRTWPQDAGSQPTSTTVRRAYDLTAAEFGPGANGPLLVMVDLEKVDASRLPELRDELSEIAGVKIVGPPAINPQRTLALLPMELTTGPQDTATQQFIVDLRARMPAGMDVTGLTTVYTDVADTLEAHLPVVVFFVVAMALVLLTAVFRSVVVSLKAALMNILSVAAAYGVVTAVFQWGWGVHLLGLPHAVPVSSYVPILMFAVLFGLSMDYEVFLLSRIREHWLATGDGPGSVVEGLAGTGRVITSAAAIMVSVFAAFAFDSSVIIKMTGFGMAVAVFLDATLVRMVLVPSTMALLGSKNWWLPGWLDRILPHIDVEGTGHHATASTRAPSPYGAPGPGAVVELANGRTRVLPANRAVTVASVVPVEEVPSVPVSPYSGLSMTPYAADPRFAGRRPAPTVVTPDEAAVPGLLSQHSSGRHAASEGNEAPARTV